MKKYVSPSIEKEELLICDVTNSYLDFNLGGEDEGEWDSSWTSALGSGDE